MSKYSNMQEKKLFSLLLRNLPRKDSKILEHAFLPNGISSNKFRTYYNDSKSLWFIRVSINKNEAYYYFGINISEESSVVPKLILRFNTDGEESDIKFLSNEITIHVAINDNDSKIRNKLLNHFKLCHDPAEEDDLYHIFIRDENQQNVAMNIEKLIYSVKFDFDLDNPYLIVEKLITKKDIESIPIEKSTSMAHVVKKSKLDIHFPFKTPKIHQQETISEIINVIKQGYKYIVVETGVGLGKSTIATTLANIYQDTFVLMGNRQLEIKYKKDFDKFLNKNIFISNYDNALDIFNSSDGDIKKRKLLIMDDAHLIENKIINYINRVSDGKGVRININKNELNKYLLNKGEVCIFFSPYILNFERFVKSLSIEEENIKFIRKNSPYDFKNKIYTRNSVNMSFRFRDENKHLQIQIINEILEKHENDKGLIYADTSSLKSFIMFNIDSDRLIELNFNYRSKIQEFEKSGDKIIVISSMNEFDKIPIDQCNFQIILKLPYPIFDKNTQFKDEKIPNSYDYEKAINTVQLLNKGIESRDDYCNVYIADDRFRLDIIKSIEGLNFIPEYIQDAIVDIDLSNHGLVSKNIKKKYGVYYLYDYLGYHPNSNDSIYRLSNMIVDYKKYQYDSPFYSKEFIHFTKEFMKAISEFSNQIIGDEIEKLALVAVPSSTVERDQYATVRSSINKIESQYKKGKLKSEFGCSKEIINCNGLLTRFDDARINHIEERRTSYIEHINTIKFDISQISNSDNVAFLIFDDITTTGTIMNACEDILVNNGVNRKNIYKFALFKTLGD